jgi:tagatose-1,6-bisphosphate aldolase
MRVASLFNSAGFIGILELDHNRHLAENLGLDLNLPDNIQLLDEINTYILQLSKEVTGVIYDPIYTFKFLSKNDKKIGTLIRLEQDKETLPDSLPALFPNFSLEEISNNYALAKLELNYSPQEQKALEKKQLLAEIREYSKMLNIDVLLKLNVYDPKQLLVQKNEQTKFAFDDNQLLAIQELRSFVDILAIQNPSDPLAMATIISELDIPCLIMANKEDRYEQFKEKFRMAMENGAKGYCLSQVLWQELSTYRRADQSLDLPNIQKYFNTIVRDRLIELNRIASESLVL